MQSSEIIKNPTKLVITKLTHPVLEKKKTNNDNTTENKATMKNTRGQFGFQSHKFTQNKVHSPKSIYLIQANIIITKNKMKQPPVAGLLERIRNSNLFALPTHSFTHVCWR